MMQERLKAVEERQEKLEAESTEASGPRSSGNDFNDTEPRRSSRRSRLRDEDTARASTSGRSTLKRKRRTAETDSDESEDRRAHKVAFIHVGEGGERDLEDHLRGSQRVNLQIVSSERLPDIDATDVIHGLDSSGTSRDYVDESHRCNTACPVGCQGHLRPNEIIIYESTRFNGRLFERKRMKGRFVTGAAARDDVVLALDMADFRRIGGRRDRAETVRRPRDSSNRRREPVSPRQERSTARGHHDRFRRDRVYLRRNPHRESRREILDTVPPTPSQLSVDVDIHQKLAILLDSPPVSTTESLDHSWSSTDKSFNILLKEDDQMIMRRHPIAQSTDCVRGKQGYSSGLHMWEVSWPTRQRGTHAVIGVATRDAPLHAVGYQSLVGNSDQSWGWDLGRLKAFHNNVQVGEHFPSGLGGSHHGWSVPDTFTMVLDMDRGSLGFRVRDQWLGWAVTGLKASAPLFPIASTVWGHCEIKLKYLHGLDAGVLGLQGLVRNVIRKSINGASEKDELDTKIDKLPLPGAIKNFVKYC